jgi:hypothetical protein
MLLYSKGEPAELDEIDMTGCVVSLFVNTFWDLQLD